MKNIQAMAGGSVGYVRGVFSARCRGVAIPAELLRAHLRGVVRVGVRRRLAAEFSGYLAGDAGPVEWSAGRWRHNICSAWRSGDFSSMSEFQDWAADGECGAAIDAPPMILAGATELLVELRGRRYSRSVVVTRGGVSAAGVAVAAEKNRNECGGSCGSDKEILVECGETEGLQGSGEDSFIGGAGSCTERKRNGTEAAPGRKENVTVSDWLDRTRRALDQLQGVK